MPPIPSTISWRHARIGVAAIELTGDAAVFGAAVLGRVGIEEQHLDAAHVHGPDADGDGSAGKLHGDGLLFAFASMAGRMGASKSRFRGSVPAAIRRR